MRWIAVLFVVAFALAGCGGSSDDGSGGSSSTTSGGSKSSTTSGTSTSGTSTTTTTTTTSGGPGENHDPTADLSVDVAAGKIPLSVNFTVVATDPDAGDSVSWTLSFGDSTTPSTGDAGKKVAHVYTSVGNFTATLTVTDSHQGSATKTTVVHAVAGGLPPIHYDAKIAAVCGQCEASSLAGQGPAVCAGIAASMKGNDCDWLALGADAPGRAVHITTLDGFVDAAFLATCAPHAAEVGTKGVMDDVKTPFDIVIPAGAGCIFFYEYGDPPCPPPAPPCTGNPKTISVDII